MKALSQALCVTVEESTTPPQERQTQDFFPGKFLRDDKIPKGLTARPIHNPYGPCELSAPSQRMSLLGASAERSSPYLRANDVLALIPVSKSTLWRWVRCQKLKPWRLGPRITVFSREEVMDVFFSEASR
jgi:predicted DNA-binding transcriptional regulator AlpA